MNLFVEHRWLGVLFALFLFYALAFGMAQSYPHDADEQAHVGYMLTLKKMGTVWPDFEDFPMRTLGEKKIYKENYLNHPPLHYHLMSLFGGSVKAQRLLSIALYSGALLLLLPMGRALFCGPYSYFNYAMLLLIVSQFAYASSIITNDALAVFAGALCCNGCLRVIESPRRFGLIMMLAGLVLAGFAKFTVFLLCAILVICVSGETMRRGRRNFRKFAVFVALALAISPYVYLWLYYGSPVPSTEGYQAMAKATSAGPIAKQAVIPYVIDTLQRIGVDMLLPKGASTSVLLFGAQLFVGLLGLWGVIYATYRGVSQHADIYARFIWFGIMGILMLFTLCVAQGYVNPGVKYDMNARYFYPFAGIAALAIVRGAYALGIRQRSLAVLLIFVSFILYFVPFLSPLAERV